VICSLWAVESVIEDHLLLGADGEPLAILDTDRAQRRTYETDGERALAPDTAASGPGMSPLPPAIAEGIAAVVAAASAAPLGGAIMAEGTGMRFEWGPVARDLVAVSGNDVRFSHALDALGEARATAARTRAEALEVGLVVLTELASLVGDALRARAQARLLALPDTAQAAALTTMPAEDGANARRIVRAVETLVEGWLKPSR
jgi:hypothetical protein